MYEPMLGKELREALFKVQNEIGGTVKKNTENPFFKSNYADLEQVTRLILPVLQDNGILVSQTVENGVLSTYLTHVETGQLFASRIEVIVPDGASNPAQAYGSSITYSRRYGLMMACFLAPSDDDANAMGKKQEKKVDNSEFISNVIKLYDDLKGIENEREALESFVSSFVAVNMIEHFNPTEISKDSIMELLKDVTERKLQVELYRELAQVHKIYTE